MEQFLAGFLTYYRFSKMENVKIEDVLNILYDSCSPELMKAIKTNIGTDMSRTECGGDHHTQ